MNYGGCASNNTDKENKFNSNPNPQMRTEPNENYDRSKQQRAG